MSLQSDKSVSRETLLSDWSRKPYKPAYVFRIEARGFARKCCHFGNLVLRKPRSGCLEGWAAAAAEAPSPFETGSSSPPQGEGFGSV
jgi:hypothetical protein